MHGLPCRCTQRGWLSPLSLARGRVWQAWEEPQLRPRVLRLDLRDRARGRLKWRSAEDRGCSIGDCGIGIASGVVGGCFRARNSTMQSSPQDNIPGIEKESFPNSRPLTLALRTSTIVRQSSPSHRTAMSRVPPRSDSSSAKHPRSNTLWIGVSCTPLQSSCNKNKFRQLWRRRGGITSSLHCIDHV
jgi:hypothetical protein